MKKLVQSILTITLLCLVTGCTILKPKFSGLSEQAIKYLDTKYGAKCEYLEARAGNDSFSNDFRYDYFSCEGLDVERILVISTKIGDEQFTFIDNYYIAKYETDIKTILTESTSKLWPKAQLFYNIDEINMNSAMETISKVQDISSLDDYLSKADVYYNIAVKYSDYTNRKKVTSQLKSHFNSVKSKVNNISLRFEVIRDEDYASYDGDTFERSYGRGAGVADYVEFAYIGYDADLKCYALYWYCWECSVQQTEKVCLK